MTQLGTKAISEVKRHVLIIIMLSITLILCLIISLCLGRYPISIPKILEILSSWVAGRDGSADEQARAIIINIRFPRIILAGLTGCGLAVSGSIFQGIFNNPMAAPDTLGASSGAAFGAALAILAYGSRSLVIASSFLFGLLSVAIVYLISGRIRGSGMLLLILTGIMVSSLFTAGTSCIKLLADPDDQLPAITFWLMGSLSGAGKGDVLFVSIILLAGIIPLFMVRWKMNVLTMGDEEAKTMGIHPGRIRFTAIVCSTLLTAASVSVSGMIGWIGLLIPHLARKLVGNNYKWLLPVSMVLGAGFLLIADDVSRNLLTNEIPIGIITALTGVPFLLYLIVRGEKL